MDNLVKPFDGKGIRWSDWIRKFQVVAKNLKWEHEEDRCDYLLLFLEGDALRIVEQMPVDARKDFQAICTRLNDAFMPSPTEAHQQLIRRRLQEGESVEGLFYGLADLWRLSLGLGGSEIPEEIALKAVLPFFLSALPPMVTAQLRMGAGWDNVDGLLRQARTLMSVFSENHNAINIGAFGHRQGKSRDQGGHRSGKDRDHGSKMCYRCGDKGHGAKECWSSVSVCYWCKRGGHVADKCEEKRAGKPRAEGKPAVGGSKNVLGKSVVSWPDLPIGL